MDTDTVAANETRLFDADDDGANLSFFGQLLWNVSTRHTSRPDSHV